MFLAVLTQGQVIFAPSYIGSVASRGQCFISQCSLLDIIKFLCVTFDKSKVCVPQKSLHTGFFFFKQLSQDLMEHRMTISQHSRGLITSTQLTTLIFFVCYSFRRGV